jgi:glutathione S-transferase
MSSDITLYTWPTANGIKASITLEELGLPYKTEPIDIGTNIQKEEYDYPRHPQLRRHPANDDYT